MCQGLQHQELIKIREVLEHDKDQERIERASIPKKVDEYQYLASSSSLSLLPQSRNLEEITSVITYCSSSGGILTLGSRTFPVPIGTTIWNFGLNGLLLYEKDVRTLTQTTQGQLSLELLGVEKADKLGW